MGSPVSPIVANRYMEKVETKALNSVTGILPTHWYRHVDDTWIKIKHRNWKRSLNISKEF